MKVEKRDDGVLGRLKLIRENEKSWFEVESESEASNAVIIAQYDTLEKLYKNWKDYEEPKKHWYIDIDGEVRPSDGLEDETLAEIERLGNLFDTEEEAEKVVEKLKAWKRLKDDGFEFDGIKESEDGDFFKIDACTDKLEYDHSDLDLLFGGKDA